MESTAQWEHETNKVQEKISKATKRKFNILVSNGDKE